ncbi:MAG: TraX family protein [Eisenbergiella sp.]
MEISEGRLSRRPSLDRDTIKYIAMAAMLVNHIGTIFLTPGTLLYELFLDIGYFTAPVMCYFLVEGYRLTHSRKLYGRRLFVFAVLSELPFCLAFSHGAEVYFVAMNMIFTLFLCFLLLEVLEKEPKGFARGLLVALLILASTVSDWAILAPVYTMLFYKADRQRKAKKAFSGRRRYLGHLVWQEVRNGIRAAKAFICPRLYVGRGGGRCMYRLLL